MSNCDRIRTDVRRTYILHKEAYMEFWKKKGAQFEDFVAYVYQSLLDINDCQSIVCKHVRIKGVDGLEGGFTFF